MPSVESRLSGIRAQVAALEAGTRTPTPVLPFGDPAIDTHLPGGGLPLRRWHEIGGEGMEVETAAAPAAFAARLAGAMNGMVIWVMRRRDLHAPGVQALGIAPERLIQVCARDEAEVLAVAEDALATLGVGAVVAEAEAVDLTAGRRLQLACERGEATGLVLHRRPFGGGKAKPHGGSAAATRWRIAAAPSQGPPDLPILGPPRWAVTLERCRGGRPGAWLLESGDDHDPHPFRLAAVLADHGLAPAERRVA